MDLFTDDAVVQTDPTFPEGGTLVGHEPIRRFHEGLREGWHGGGAVIATDVRTAGDRVFASVDWTATGEASRSRRRPGGISWPRSATARSPAGGTSPIARRRSTPPAFRVEGPAPRPGRVLDAGALDRNGRRRSRCRLRTVALGTQSKVCRTTRSVPKSRLLGNVSGGLTPRRIRRLDHSRKSCDSAVRRGVPVPTYALRRRHLRVRLKCCKGLVF
jgi:hypothetical protein